MSWESVVAGGEAGRPGALGIRALLETPLADDPSAEIVYRDEVRLTYRTFRERVHRLAGALAALGIRRGDTVGVMEHDSHRYLEAMFAVTSMGAVLHTINVRLSTEQILHTIQHAEDDLLIVNADYLQLLGSFLRRLDLERFIVISNGRPSETAGLSLAADYEAMLAACPARFEFPDLPEDARATLFYTTGTTGQPKGVSFTHRQIVLHTLASAAALAAQHHGSLRRGDVYMPLTPMFHVHAWGFPFVATFLGLKQVYPGRWTPEGLLELAGREHVTFSHCVPTVLHMLLESTAAKGAKLEGWKILVGGAPLPKALAARALTRGVDVVTAYGMSETCPLLSLGHLDPSDLAEPPEDQLELRTRTGRALPLVELRVADPQLREVARNGQSTGEVVAKAPWLTAGYHKDAQATERLWRGGVLHTGDVAWRDERGSLRITDRLKDVIKVGGEWLSSLVLEDALAMHPAVREVAVIAVVDPKWGERPLAVVVPRSAVDGEKTGRELTAHIREHQERGLLPRQALLTQVRLAETIDRTSVGKIDKRALRARYAGDLEREGGRFGEGARSATVQSHHE